jgi:hypothetical protein
LASKPYTARIILEDGKLVIKVDWAAIPDDPGAILGDCIHNLRTSLDLMACELVRSVNGNDNRVYFPFSHSEDDLDLVIKEKNFHRAGQDAVELVKSLKPYRGGNQMLRAMHDLDIEDKHKALIVTATGASIAVEGAYSVDDPENGNIAVTAADVYFTFSQEGILPGLNVIKTLEQLVEVVDGILEAFVCLIGRRATDS